MKAKLLASRMGITPTMLTRFLSGEAKYCYPETLRKMVEGISPLDEVRAELLRAYLLDQRPEGTSHLVEIHPAKKASVAASDSLSELAHALGLSAETIDAIAEIIRACGNSFRVSRLVIDAGQLVANDLNQNRPILERRSLRAAETPPVYGKSKHNNLPLP